MNENNGESGYMVIEASVIFPIIILAICAFLLISTYVYEKAALQSAAEITLTYYKNSLTDSYVGAEEMFGSYNVAVSDERTGSVIGEKGFIDQTPIRFLTSKADENEIKKQFEVIYGYKCFETGRKELKVNKGGFLFSRYIELEISDVIYFPLNLKLIGIDSNKIRYNITVRAAANDNDQFIRDFSIAHQFADVIFEKTGIKSKFTQIGNKFKMIYNRFFNPYTSSMESVVGTGS